MNKRLFAISLSQKKYRQLGLFERRQNLFMPRQNIVTQEQKCEKVRSKLQRLQKHTDLESFLSMKDLNTKSSVYKGTLYEYETISCLQKNFGIISTRVGKCDDFGIDFRARWKLPNEKKISIVGQCKNTSNKCSPSSVRELEGVLGMEMIETDDILGILSSKSGFSIQTIRRFHSSPRPIILVCVVDNGERCESFTWNSACEKILEGLEITLNF